MTTLSAGNPQGHLTGQQPPVSPVQFWLIRVLLMAVLGTALLVLTLAVIIMAVRIHYTDRITPGVSAYGLDLGGMTQPEAVDALSARLTYPQDAVFTLRDGEDFWQLTAAELGVSFDAEATVETAFSAGNGDDFIGGLVNQAITWFEGESVAPVIRYDQSMAAAKLVEIAAELDRAAVNATLEIQGTEVVTTTGQAGRTIDIPATLARLDSVVMTLTPGGEIPLVITESQPQIWNADVAANRIRAALSGPLELFAERPDGTVLGPWTASVEQIATLLDLSLVENADGTFSYAVGVDTSVFADYLETLAPGLVQVPEDGRFQFNEETRELEVLQASVPGRSLDIPATLARMEEALFRFDSRRVPMAFEYVQPRYHDGITAAELGITQMVAEATTTYAGSPANRVHNITEGASRFNGLIVAPGEEFSFNYWLGEVSEEAGFVQSLVIQGERTVDGIGGGVCQVSTTAFRAAFFGGYRIIERNSHAYRVGYYEMMDSPPGLDAAIWTPDRDMRFQNDTDYHLLIEVSVNPVAQTIQFRIYSTPTRQVIIEPPTVRNVTSPPPAQYEPNSNLNYGEILQVDWAAEGADVNVVRVINDLDGELIREDTLYTHYLPWGAIYQVAPGDPRLSG